jgi:hypothetical protein
MTDYTLADLQASVQDRLAFNDLADYMSLCRAFLMLVETRRPTRIISPSHRNYIFYQYDETYGHKITRPLNSDLFIESVHDFQIAFERFVDFLDDLKQYHESIVDNQNSKSYIETREVNKIVYTIQ